MAKAVMMNGPHANDDYALNVSDDYVPREVHYAVMTPAQHHWVPDPGTPVKWENTPQPRMMVDVYAYVGPSTVHEGVYWYEYSGRR
jgi:hypothetical protein